MTLSCYLRPINYTGIDPSLARSVPPSILTEVSKEVKKAEAEERPKKRGTYLTFTAKEKARVATYGSINRARAAVERFSKEYDAIAYRASGVTKFKTTKINSEDPRQLFTNICTSENYPLYGIYIFQAVRRARAVNAQRANVGPAG